MIKHYIVITIFAMVLAVYFASVGLFFDKDAIPYMFTCLISAVITFFICVKTYIKVINGIKDEFINKTADEVLKFSLFIENNSYYIYCLNNNSQFKFSNDDVKKIKFTKNLIVITLNLNFILYFPKNKDVEQIFNSLI